MRYFFHSVLFLLFLPFAASSQYGIEPLFEELPADSIQPLSVENHTGLKPQIRSKTVASWKKDKVEKANYFFIAPALDLNGAYSSKFNFRSGAGLNMHAQTGKWFFKVGAVGGIGSVDSFFNTRSFYLERKGELYNYVDVRGRVSYTPNEVFNFQVGLDNHFIGEGSRSLFLGDYGTPHPFGQIRTKFWRVEYTVLYQFMREQVGGQWKSKYATTHHISLNATKWLNFGIFESVLFQPKDTLLNRGFEAEYLNPVIFFRPQEYSLGSSDNVLIGFSMDAKFKGQTFYSQFILDEFNLKEIRNKSAWWANKFGLQVGLKGRFKPAFGALFYRVEYNMLRPYTYAHINEMQAYGHQGNVLAHPLGANFHEILAELKWQRKDWLVKFFTSYRLQGADKDGFSYGANIYQPYTLRPEDYGFKIGRGAGQNMSRTILTIDYDVWKPASLHIFLENHLVIKNYGKEFSYYPMLGIRSQLWNDYRNY